jgi:hypothetical protein
MLGSEIRGSLAVRAELSEDLAELRVRSGLDGLG